MYPRRPSNRPGGFTGDRCRAQHDSARPERVGRAAVDRTGPTRGRRASSADEEGPDAAGRFASAVGAGHGRRPVSHQSDKGGAVWWRKEAGANHDGSRQIDVSWLGNHFFRHLNESGTATNSPKTPCIATANGLPGDNRSTSCIRSRDIPPCRRFLANAAARKRSRLLDRTSARLCRY